MHVNPFDIRTVVLAKHGQHVVLIHFPVALFVAAVAFDYLAQWTRNQALAAAAYSTCCWPAVRQLSCRTIGYPLKLRSTPRGVDGHLGGLLRGVNGP